MKNILIIPSNFITQIDSRKIYKIKNIIKSFLALNYKNIIEAIYSHNLCAENYHYEGFSEIKNLNISILGKYYKEYTLKNIPEFSRYPSLHNSQLKNFKSLKNVRDNIADFDCIIFGSRISLSAYDLLKLAKQKNIPRVLIDHFDDQQIYFTKNYRSHIEKRFKFKIDFDLMFKHDVPLDCDLDYVHPICPMPIRYENYLLINPLKFDKKLDISFSGRVGHNNSNDRELLKKIIKNINKSSFREINYKEKVSLKSYLKNLSESKICLSPYGKVWDSTRHSELAVYNCLPVIPTPNCKLSDGINVNDQNSINYKIEYNKYEKKFIIENPELLKDKINYYLKNNDILISHANNWRKMILTNNNFKARANFIFNKIKKFFNV